MKQLIGIFGCCAVATMAFAGTASFSGKEMKQVAPAPVPECNWTGFYIGINVGGNFGHAENTDVDDYNFPDKPWGYSTSGVVGGGDLGYNYQWNWLVLGVEADLGYMNIDGDDQEPDRFFQRNDTVGHSESDFYTTIRGRLGVAFGHWLFYGTGGAIGLNWHTSVEDNCFTGNCGIGTIDASRHDFEWGWTAGGGIEYMLNCHWTVKAEYLYYEMDDQTFSGTDFLSGVTPNGKFSWDARAEGNIVRAGLNYKF